MKVWRGFTALAWSILIADGVAIILFNNALQNTLLNRSHMTSHLAKSTFYEQLRDKAMTDYVYSEINSRYPNKLIDKELIREALQRSISKEEMRERTEPVIATIYRWLDSKEPEVTFSLSFDDKKNVFYQNFEKSLEAKVAKLPVCELYVYPPEDALMQQSCRPDYATSGEATQAIMGGIRSGETDSLSTITESSVMPAMGESSRITRIPSYLNYLWVLNLLSIAVIIFAALYVTIARRLTGAIICSVSLILAGLALLIFQPTIHTEFMRALTSSGYSQALSGVLTSFSSQVNLRASIALISGLALTVLLGAWKWRQRKADS